VFETTPAGALPGPDWLRERRRAAAERLAESSLPSVDEEVWRYSRIAELEPSDFEVGADVPPEGELPAEVAEILASVPERAGAVVVSNGFVVHTELGGAWADKGVSFGSSHRFDGAALSASHDDPVDVFALANVAFGADPVVLDVPGGLVVDTPFVVIDWIDVDGAATFPRVVVRTGPDSQVSVLEWQASGPVRSLCAPVTHLDVGQAARLGHVVVQARGTDVWQIANQTAQVSRDATLLGAQASLGGDYARSRIDCRLVGRGASGTLLAAYFGEGSQMLDFRTFQDHLAPDSTSDLLFKGAVSGSSRSVYTGLIHVGKEARGTNAFQTNRNIKLSDGAWAESVPNLEIENNDVRCSHASTVGPVDEEQRFYLESRGVPTPVAERLIVAGFFDEVLDRLPVPAVAALLELELDRRLARRDR
jgi:Fe-S cluster assembly protein SufD